MLEFILATLGDAVVYGIFYAITWITSRTLTTTGDFIQSVADTATEKGDAKRMNLGDTIQSVADTATKTPDNRKVIIFALIMFGFVAGAMISVIFPERIVKIGSITGISLLITPLIIGMITSYVGRCGKKQGRSHSITTTFLGGALFGLTAAVTRLIFVIQKQA